MKLWTFSQECWKWQKNTVIQKQVKNVFRQMNEDFARRLVKRFPHAWFLMSTNYEAGHALCFILSMLINIRETAIWLNKHSNKVLSFLKTNFHKLSKIVGTVKCNNCTILCLLHTKQSYLKQNEWVCQTQRLS